MKTNRRFQLLLAVVAVLVMGLGLASCGNGAPSAADVAKKIDAKEQLSQADYGSILDYCGDYAKKAQQYFDVINAQPNDSTVEYANAAADMAKLVEQYPYLDMFRSVVYNLTTTDLDEANQKKIDEYAKYQAFPLPEGAGVDLANPDVVGDIEQMPDTDTSDVISEGAGEAVDVNVKD